jgi:hypothetical protein
MRRLDFIAGLGSAAAWPVVARALRKGLSETGFVLMALGLTKTHDLKTLREMFQKY